MLRFFLASPLPVRRDLFLPLLRAQATERRLAFLEEPER
jgi:hypothetical protein